MDGKEIFLLAVLGLAALATLAYLLHRHSLEKFDYSPFQLGNLLCMLIPPVSLGASLFYLEGQGFTDAILSGNWAVIVLCVICAGSLGWFLRRLRQRTNIWVALGGTGLLLIAAVLVVAIVVAVLLALGQGKSGNSGSRRRRR